MSTKSTNSLTAAERFLYLIFGGVLLGHLPLVAEHFVNLWKQPQYQYFPIILGTIGWLMWKGIDGYRESPRPPIMRYSAIGLIGVSLAGIAFSTWYLSPWCAMLSLTIAFAGVMMWLSATCHVVNPVGIWSLSLLLLRPPMGFDSRLAFWLQGVTSRISGALLDMVGVVNLVEGNTIILRERHLFVEEACSGIVSLMSIIACCAIMAVWQFRPAPHAILLTISGAFWAGILNIFRIVIMAVCLDRYQLDLTEGFKHSALGMVLFAVTLLLSFCTDRFLLFMMTPIRHPDGSVIGLSPLSKIWNYVVEPASIFRKDNGYYDDSVQRPVTAAAATLPKWMLPASIAFVCVGVSQIVLGAMAGDTFTRIEPVAGIQNLAEDSMPESMTVFKRVNFEAKRREIRDQLGEQSRIWLYAAGSRTCTFSVDFVFMDWHELTTCYEGIGWKNLDRDVFTRAGSDQTFVACEFGKDDGQRAYLLFGAFNQLGEPILPPDSGLTSGFRHRLAKGSGVVGGVYQAQVLVPSKGPLAEDQKRQIQDAYYEFYDRLRSAARGN